MLILPRVRYGIWTDKAQGHFMTLQYFGTTLCHGSECCVCQGKNYLRKDGTMGGGRMYVFSVVYSFDARRVICPKCVNKYLWQVKYDMPIGFVDYHGMQ